MDHTGNSPGPNTQPSWTNRRRVMWTVLLFCMACVGYILGFGGDTQVEQTAVSMAFVIIGSTVSSYVFGAVWEDTKLRS